MTRVNFVAKEPKKISVIGLIDNKLNACLKNAVKRKPQESVVELFVEGSQRILIAKVDGTPSRKKYEEAGAALYNKFIEGVDRELVLDVRHQDEALLHIAAGILIASWRFDKYRTVKERTHLDELTLICSNPKEMKLRFAKSQALLEGITYARNLTSEPPNLLPPMLYAERLKELKELGIAVKVLDETALHRAGMQALLAVGRGSKHPPAAVTLTWNGLGRNIKPIAVVGKGICFDSGGLCLKPPKQQLEMKWDKAGAGVVAGLLKALALQKAPVNVVGVVGLAENMPDGNAARPGDVIRTMSGQTVEIADTDAEGRLVLADCLWYAKETFSPSVMVDLGTLCLETVATLGNHYGGLYSNSSALVEELKMAGKASGEELWELPMGEFFAKQIESSVADIKNVGLESCGENGAAAEFLKRFVGDIPWAHIDIAGVAWTKEDLLLARKGVTGFGVKLLEEWINSRRQ